MLTLENVNVVFGKGTPDENHALKNVNLKIAKGDFITVIGSNGAGKSTLLNAIAGSVMSESGSIRLNAGGAGELDVTKQSEHRRARFIGRIFQNPLLGTAGNMSLEDNMVVCEKKGYRGLRLGLNNARREMFRERIGKLSLGLERRLRDNVALFSGGQRQALTLLMAVMSRPEVLLLDEHTAALDPVNAERVLSLTKEFARDFHLTVLMITHNMKNALDMGNRLLMMDAGEIILDIGGNEKQNLTLADLQERFRAAKRRDLANDEMLLS
ncbi:MAG: ATP-binding cassette domain-containing protein [Spirochaetaceae bacterium]|jgi:putative ABC transport system ATP-binding protein|nr:ATP-binding cassette domain-containing protein [Spirochaetaceae bacterium]